MNKPMRVVILGLLLMSLMAGCGQSSQPTPTPGPTPTPIPGFKKIEAGGVELWVPENFEGGDLTSGDRELIVERLRSLGPDFASVAQTIEQNPNMFLLFAADTKLSDSGFMTNINVGREKVLSTMSLDTYTDAAIKQLPSQMKVDKREAVNIGPYQANRLTLDFGTVGAREVLYIIKGDGVMYLTAYATGQKDFDQKLPIFEQSIQTFRIK